MDAFVSWDKFILQVFKILTVECSTVELETLATYSSLRNLCVSDMGP